MKNKSYKNRRKLIQQAEAKTKEKESQVKKKRKPAEKKAGMFSNPAFWIAAILVVTLAVYLPAFQNEFTNWDDPGYVVENSLIKDLSMENLGKIFKEPYFSNYQPVTLLVYALTYHFWGLDAFWFHFVNIIIHLINTLLVFILIRKLTQNLTVTVIVAALFGIHTMHVESVAWVSELKDVLYSMFFLGSLILYTDYVKKLPSKNYARVVIYFVVSLLLFYLSILSKGQAVMLAMALFGIDFIMQRKDYIRLLIEKIPFFFLSIWYGLVAMAAQKGSGAMYEAPDFDFIKRLLYAADNFFIYIFKLIIPSGLSAFHPYPLHAEGVPITYYIALVGLLLVIALSIYALYKRYRLLFFGIWFYAINISIVLQFLPVGSAKISERYSYLPSLGIFLLMAMGAYFLMKKYFSARVFLSLVLIIYMGVLSFLTYNRGKIWQNSITLWTDVINKYSDSPRIGVAYNNRGNALKAEGRVDEAIRDYNMNIKIKQANRETYENLANAYRQAGRMEEAMAIYEKNLSEDGNFVMSMNNMGNAMFEQGKFKEALGYYNEVLSLDSSYTRAFSNRGSCKFNLGDLEGAIKDYNRALELEPDFVDALMNRGCAKAMLGRQKEAIPDFNKVLKLDPDNKATWFFRGMARYESGNEKGGCADLAKSAEMGYEKAVKNLEERCK